MVRLPNILVTGTPGTGKTETCKRVADVANLKHLEIGSIVKEFMLHDGYDGDYDTYILNDSKLIDYLRNMMKSGGMIIDFHSPSVFPEDWFDHVYVLQTSNDILYPRLEQRGYADRKLKENIECEIMQVITSETYESYDKGIIDVLQSHTDQDMANNVKQICQFIAAFRVGE